MSALEAGVKAPEITIPFLDSQSDGHKNGNEFSLRQAATRGPVVLAFFKVSCPICQLAFPFLERLHRAYKSSGKFTMVSVSQDNKKDTQAFYQRFGIRFPALLDPEGKYPASQAYGLTNVPSTFLISSDGEIEFSSVGWSRRDMEELNRKLAEASGMAVAPLFQPSDKVPDHKPG